MQIKRISIFTMLLVVSLAATTFGQAKFSVPSSGRAVYNFNPGWKFIKQEVPGADAPEFDDSKWDTVSTPHTYNDIDSFDERITRGGEVTLYTGPAQYRKHFKLPASALGSKVFLEFEGMRQAAKFWVNGKPVGKYENGVTACGVDITEAVNFGDKENVLSVWITNVTNYAEESSGTVFQWESKDFNPNYGGINQNVWLHIVPKVYQTLPIINNLNTTGTYVYPSEIKVDARTATLNVESQVRNESEAAASVSLSAVVVDADGNIRAQVAGETSDLAKGETKIFKASGPMASLQFWSPANPYLYDVYTILTMQGKVVDVQKTTTGFRKAEFKGGAGTGGVFVNDKFEYLKGFAIRSTNEWAAVGGAYPDWMSDFNVDLMRASHGNYIRWMHIAPKPKDVRSCDRFGIVQVCPAGDKEADPPEAQWKQRIEVMRATMIYFRNSPSILFWEAGNNAIAPERLQQMVDLRKQLDPAGGRVMGTRHGANNQLAQADTHISEWFGVMIAQDRPTEQLSDRSSIFRGFSYERRDLAPFIETEDFRDEGFRGIWDNYSPPTMGFKKGPNDAYDHNSESFSLAAANRYNAYWSHRVSLSDPKLARWAAYCSIIWADSNQHGRMPDHAVARVSGKVDAVRIPKQAYFVHRVMQNEKPDTHIIGHWTYPKDTKKTMYVAASNVDAVELSVNGQSKGKVSEPQDGFIFAFPDVAFAAGSIKAVGYKAGKTVTQHELKTVGDPKSLKLTLHTGPKGLLADGSDVAFIDFEVVDANGDRCPTDEGKVDFEIAGPAVWRGGVNEFTVKSTNNLYLNTECGINRVFIRSTVTPGKITLTARREGLTPATITIDTTAVETKDGLAAWMPQTMANPAK